MKTVHIFTDYNIGIHIIDLRQTVGMIETAYGRTRSVVSSGSTVLFVGTKSSKSAASVQETAESCGMPYINNRWLGGTLITSTIRQRVDYMIKLEQQRDRGDFERLTKKEALELNRLIARLETQLGGRARCAACLISCLSPTSTVMTSPSRNATSWKSHRCDGGHQLTRIPSTCHPGQRRRHSRHQS